MDASRSAQEESDEDNNSSPPRPERNGASAGGGGMRDPDDLAAKPQRKRVYIHRCPFTHDCSNHCKDRKRASDLPPNVPTDTSQTLYARDSRKIQNLCQQAASDSAEYTRFLKNVQNVQNVGPLPSVEGDNVYMPVFNQEHRLVFLQRGVSRTAGGGVRRAPLFSSPDSPPTPESPLRRTCSTQSYPPYIGAQPFHYYPQETDSPTACPSPPLSFPGPYPPAHRTFPEDIKPQCSSRRSYSGVPSTSQISRIRDTANILASLGAAPEDLSHLPYSPSPPTPSSPGAATSITSDLPSSCQSDVITPPFRQYCRHFFLESLCPGATENQVRQVATAVECLEDRVYLYNAKSKMDYCLQLATKLCCIQEELQQISRVSQQGISPLGGKRRDPS